MGDLVSIASMKGESNEEITSYTIITFTPDDRVMESEIVRA